MEDQLEQEQALLRQAQAGDLDAFGELCRSYEGRLLRQAFAAGCDDTAAQDLVQDTLLQAWKSFRRYNGSCRFYTWLCAILLNRHRGMLRKNRLLALLSFLRADTAAGDAALQRVPATEATPDQAAQDHERAALLQRCIAALPAKQQQVIYLRFYADDSLAGIAAALGCSVGTVKSRLFHALDRLRTMKAFRSPEDRKLLSPPHAAPAKTQLAVL